MRVSPGKRHRPNAIRPARRRFNFGRHLTPDPASVFVGLVGGSDPASVAVRRAQSIFRFDRRPAYFSQAFVFTGRDDDIVECRLVGADPTTPQTGGIHTAQATERYGDVRRFPNAAIVRYRFLPVAGGVAPERRAAEVLRAARDAVAVRERYDLWGMIADWQGFLYEPERRGNPLAGDVPHPGATFVRWALSAGGLESSPGALDQCDTPEHIWAACLWWVDSYADASVGVEVSVSRHVTDKNCALTG